MAANRQSLLAWMARHEFFTTHRSTETDGASIVAPQEGLVLWLEHIRAGRVVPSVPPCTVFGRCNYFSQLDVRLCRIDRHQRDCCAGVSLHRAAAPGHRAPLSSLAGRAACDSLATMTTGRHWRWVGERNVLHEATPLVSVTPQFSGRSHRLLADSGGQSRGERQEPRRGFRPHTKDMGAICQEQREWWLAVWTSAPNALRRTAVSRCGSNRRVSWPPSLRLGR